jgi:hypothetical protein
MSGINVQVRPGKTPKARAEVRYLAAEAGELVYSDVCDLATARGRQSAALDHAAALGARGFQVTAEWLEAKLESAWLLALKELDAPPEPPPPGDDLEALEQRRLDEMHGRLRDDAEAMLKDSRLLERVAQDAATVGVAGETDLVLSLYLLGTSRKLPRPLAGIVKGPSASGKSYAINGVASLFPPEGVIRATRLTPQALFHMPQGGLSHRWVVGGERARGLDDETAQATAALREMLSEGRLSKLMPMKLGGQLETVLIQQEGPIAFVESTTQERIFEEDENRLVQLYTDETPEQTRRVIDFHARRAAGHGPGAAEVERAVEVSRGLQRMLKRLPVVIPFAEHIAARIAPQRVEARRAVPHLLRMIEASALLHQQQRALTTEGDIIAARGDYETAFRLLQGALRRLLGRAVGDPARRFFDRLREWFPAREFTTTEVRAREATSRGGVHAWLEELSRVGAVELVQAGRGVTPHRWRIAEQAPAVLDEVVLPTAQEIFGE